MCSLPSVLSTNSAGSGNGRSVSLSFLQHATKRSLGFGLDQLLWDKHERRRRRDRPVRVLYLSFMCFDTFVCRRTVLSVDVTFWTSVALCSSSSCKRGKVAGTGHSIQGCKLRPKPCDGVSANAFGLESTRLDLGPATTRPPQDVRALASLVSRANGPCMRTNRLEKCDRTWAWRCGGPTGACPPPGAHILHGV